MMEMYIFAFWGLLLFILVRLIHFFHWRKIRAFATVYANHFDISLKPDGTIRFLIRKNTPWSEQSYAYQQILNEITTLVRIFASGLSTLLVGAAWLLFSPVGWWRIPASFVFFLFFYALVYVWGMRSIPGLIGALLHFPEGHFGAAAFQISFRAEFLQVVLLIALWLILNIDAEPVWNLYLLWSIFCAYPPLVFSLAKNRNFAAPTQEKYLRDYVLADADVRQSAEIDTLLSTPQLKILIDSLPAYTSQVVWRALQEGVTLDVLTFADQAPFDERLNNPILRQLSESDPERPLLNMDRLLYQLRKMLSER